MNKPFNIHIPISKVDEEQRMVYGIATTEAVDSQGDIVDYEASKAAFSAWLGNIREMHQPVAVGKAVDIQFDDENRQVVIGAKISESIDGENAWIKVKEGILNGFSIGGSVSKVLKETAKVGDADVNVTRIVDYSLSETSLVDNPANPEALFVMVKSAKSGLQRVEEMHEGADVQKAFRLPAWHAQFMPPIEKAQALYSKSMKKGKQTDMKKGMWDASFLLDLAIELNYYIQGEQYEGEDVADLQSALDTIKQAVVKELTEPTQELSVAVELAEKVTSLKKGKDVKKSTAVVGGEERDHNAEVVTTAEENGKPAEAPAAEAPAKEEKAAEAPKAEEPAKEEPKAEEPAAPAAEEAPKAEEPKKVDVKVEDAPAEEPAAPAAEAPAAAAEPSAEESEKAVTVGDLKKFTDGLISKLSDSNKEQFAKALGEFADKVDADFTALKGRIEQLEAQPAAPKARASYVTVEKGKEAGTGEEVDVKELLKRRDELAANPNLGTPQERIELAQALRKAARNGAQIA